MLQIHRHVRGHEKDPGSGDSNWLCLKLGCKYDADTLILTLLSNRSLKKRVDEVFQEKNISKIRGGAGWGRWAYLVKCRSSLNAVICRQFCSLTLKASVFLFLMHQTFWFGFTKGAIRVIKAKLVINATSLSCSLMYIYIYITHISLASL